MMPISGIFDLISAQKGIFCCNNTGKNMNLAYFRIEDHHIALVTLVIFFITYAGIAIGHGLIWKLDRTGIALLGGIAMLSFGCVTLPQAVASINMPSILLLFGLMVIAGQLHYAGFYQWAAQKIAGTLDRPALFLALLMGASGALSAFLNNAVVVLAFAPVITFALLRKKLNPAPFLIALPISANIGCAATIVGNAQNVLIGEIGQLDFGQYMLFALPPVLVSMAAAYAICYYLGQRDFYRPVAVDPERSAALTEEVPFNWWRVTKGLGILLVVIILLVTTHYPSYLLALTGAGLLLCSQRLESRKVLALVNWQLLVLFIGLFVVVGAFSANGFAGMFRKILFDHSVNLHDPSIIAIVSAVLSNLINNSAAVMLLIQMIDINVPENAYALAISNAFAGNLLLIGSMTNLVAAQSAESCGVKIGFLEFARYGIPASLTSLGVLLLYLS